MLHRLLSEITATGSSTSVTLSAEVIEHERVELCVFSQQNCTLLKMCWEKTKSFPCCQVIRVMVMLMFQLRLRIGHTVPDM